MASGVTTAILDWKSETCLAGIGQKGSFFRLVIEFGTAAMKSTDTPTNVGFPLSPSANAESRPALRNALRRPRPRARFRA
jgi:hypothetical protein